MGSSPLPLPILVALSTLAALLLTALAWRSAGVVSVEKAAPLGGDPRLCRTSGPAVPVRDLLMPTHWLLCFASTVVVLLRRSRYAGAMSIMAVDSRPARWPARRAGERTVAVQASHLEGVTGP